MTWLSVTEYRCHKSPRICSVCRNHNPVLSSFVTYHKSNMRMPPVKITRIILRPLSALLLNEVNVATSGSINITIGLFLLQLNRKAYYSGAHVINSRFLVGFIFIQLQVFTFLVLQGLLRFPPENDVQFVFSLICIKMINVLLIIFVLIYISGVQHYFHVRLWSYSSNTMGATSGVVTVYPSGAHMSSPWFIVRLVSSIFSFLYIVSY